MFIVKYVFVWRPHPLLYASSSIFALSSALISALISSKLTEGLAGSLSCSDTLFPLHCFRLEKNSQPWTPTHHNTVALSQNGQLQLWLSGGVHYRHHHRHGKYEQKKKTRAGTLQLCYGYSRLLTEHLAQTLESSALIITRYDWSLVPGLCQTLAQMFRLRPRIGYPSTAGGFDYFLCFQGYFHLTGAFLCSQRHILKVTQTSQTVALQHKMLLIRTITSSGSSWPIVSRTVWWPWESRNGMCTCCTCSPV